MTQVTIVGDGPAGLSAALFLAKNGVSTTVFGQDATAMHHAHLYNYLGIEDLDGTAFQEIARRQVAEHGAELRAAEVTDVAAQQGGFRVRAGDDEVVADYVILAGGKSAQSLAALLGAEADDGRVKLLWMSSGDLGGVGLGQPGVDAGLEVGVAGDAALDA